MERVREAVDLARRATARAPEAAIAAERRRRRSSNASQQPSQASAEEAAFDDPRSKLACLLPDTPADQLMASLDAASGSSAGELKVRGESGERERDRMTESVELTIRPSRFALDLLFRNPLPGLPLGLPRLRRRPRAPRRLRGGLRGSGLGLFLSTRLSDPARARPLDLARR